MEVLVEVVLVVGAAVVVVGALVVVVGAAVAALDLVNETAPSAAFVFVHAVLT